MRPINRGRVEHAKQPWIHQRRLSRLPFDIDPQSPGENPLATPLQPLLLPLFLSYFIIEIASRLSAV